MAVIYGLKSDEQAIEALETMFSIKFTEDYRTFLLEKNGLFVNGDDDYIHIDYTGVDLGIDFDRFYGIHSKRKYFDLIYQNKEYLDELYFIPFAFLIGADPGGNFFVLVTEGKDAGAYYWDRAHLHECDDKQDYYFEEVDESGQLYRIANSFSDFYQLLEGDLKKFRISEDTL